MSRIYYSPADVHLADFQKEILSCDFIFVEDVLEARRGGEENFVFFDKELDPHCIVVDVDESGSLYPEEVDGIKIGGHKICVFFGYSRVSRHSPRCIAALKPFYKQQSYNILYDWSKIFDSYSRLDISSDVEFELYIGHPFSMLIASADGNSLTGFHESHLESIDDTGMISL